MQFLYFGVAMLVFVTFGTLFVRVARALRGGFIEANALWFLSSYALVFFLKATIFTLLIFPSFNQNTLINFVFLFAISVATDLVMLLLYILEMREVVLKLEATSYLQYLESQFRHRKLKICVFSAFFLIKLTL